MTKFRVRKSKDAFFIEAKQRKLQLRWDKIAEVRIARFDERKKELSISWIADEARRLKASPKQALREAFIEQFGTTPARMLGIALVQHFGSEEKGLTVEGLAILSAGEFIERLLQTGLAQKHGEKIVISPAVVKGANAIGKIELGKPLTVSKEIMQALLPRPKPKPVRRGRAPPAKPTVKRISRRH